jgi:hypothetical protein
MSGERTEISGRGHSRFRPTSRGRGGKANAANAALSARSQGDAVRLQTTHCGLLFIRRCFQIFTSFHLVLALPLAGDMVFLFFPYLLLFAQINHPSLMAQINAF